jgi:hypothetical protein
VRELERIERDAKIRAIGAAAFRSMQEEAWPPAPTQRNRHERRKAAALARRRR